MNKRTEEQTERERTTAMKENKKGELILLFYLNYYICT